VMQQSHTRPNFESTLLLIAHLLALRALRLHGLYRG